MAAMVLLSVERWFSIGMLVVCTIVLQCRLGLGRLGRCWC